VYQLPLPPKSSLVLISFRSRLNPRAIVLSEGLSQWKTPIIPSVMEPVTFQLVAQCLNRLQHRVLNLSFYDSNSYFTYKSSLAKWGWNDLHMTGSTEFCGTSWFWLCSSNSSLYFVQLYKSQSRLILLYRKYSVLFFMLLLLSVFCKLSHSDEA